MKVTKCKVTSDGAEVEWEEERAGVTIEGKIPHGDLAHPDLLVPWKALRKFVLELLGFTIGKGDLPGEDPEDWELRSVRWKHGTESLKVAATVMRPIPTHTSPLLINTPEWTMPAGDGDEDSVIPVAMRRHLRTVHAEAVEYVEGKRAQGELELEDDS